MVPPRTCTTDGGYMQLTLTICGYHLLSTTSFVGMGDIVTEVAFRWVAKHICKLMDDVIGHKFEQKRGHMVSAVECCMKEYPDVTEEAAKEELNVRVFNAWKDINGEYLRPTPIPMLLLTRILNLARAMDALYKDEDNYIHAVTELKEYVKCMLVEALMM